MRRTRWSAGTAGATAACALLLVACTPSAASSPSSRTASPASASASAAASGESLTGDLVVLAAASLQTTFEVLGDRLEEQHPGLEVTFSFAASSTLARQAVAGAPADVLATASSSTMQDAAAAVRGEPTVFAHNSLVVVVPAGNPGDVSTVADLADPGRTVALCAVEVPCGAASQAVFAAAGLTPAPDTYEADVTATLTKVVLGEVDGALVYLTDARAAGEAVESFAFPEAAQARNDYPIAVLTQSGNPSAAQAFVDLVLSDAGQGVLTAAGFAGR
ncbi:molybdate ABC transporter substrate-binding protein [Cellulomonas soli]|uniref:molybdate ABC transporter substrate-binding protein n=1 Tax=Cellulomonas soli TaxID=931535 RepID=UPI003F857C77